jgi:predicted GNAT family acetyltransferase
MTTPAEGSETAPDVRFVKNETQSRYEAWVGDALAGIAQYRDFADHVVFPHTEVEPEFEGKGIAGQLARYALDDVVDQGKLIVPLCPYMTVYVKRHPEYQAHLRP